MACRKFCKVSPGCSVFINVSPIRNPRNPAVRRRFTISGSEIPLSDTNTASWGSCPANRNEFSTSVKKVPKLRLLIPTISIFSLIYDNSSGLWISSRTSSPKECAFSVSSLHLSCSSAAAIRSTASAPTIFA